MSTQARDLSKAKRIVEQQKAGERRHKVTLWTMIGVVSVLVIALLAGWVAVSGQDKGKITAPSVAIDESTAFQVGTGAVTIDLYEDFMCPVCHEFENQSGATIKELVADKKVTVRYHPVAILDRESNGTEYSTRACGAAAAAAEGGKFIEYHDVLYQNQPSEGSDGLTDATLIELGKSVGLGSAFGDAINNKTYTAWAGKVTDTFSARGYTGTPTVLVAGKQLTGVPTPAQLTESVNNARA